MLALPAIDLREGACVQLVGGDYDAERVRVPDPLAQARHFREQGFSCLHVVDLDAATGRGDNRAVVERLVASSGLSVQTGGGVRTPERVAELLALGATRVVVGTRAVEDPRFCEHVASTHPGRVVVAIDVRDREVLVRGWQRGAGRDVRELAAELDRLPLAGLLVTAVHKEGTLGGVDEALYRELAQITRLPLVASGGVGGDDDLARVAEAGCAAAVIGMALYTGAIDGRGVAARWSAPPAGTWT